MIEFDSKSHTYKLHGKTVPSVTTVISEMALLPAYPAARRDYYLARGSATHLATELYDHGKLRLVDDRLTGYLEAWKAFLAESGFRPVLIEQIVWSEQFRYCGTLDRWGYLDQDETIVDIKSGDPPEAAALQTAAYKRALFECQGRDTKRRIAVHLAPSGKYKVTEFAKHAEDDRMFLMALSLFNWKEANL